jgi:3-isopropylmalate/(R)-2-methylmalate dehydratase large subunit
MRRTANKAQGVAVGLTMVEKILARTSGRSQVRAGDNIEAKPDFVVAYDFPGYTDVIFQQMKNDFGIVKMSMKPKHFF